MSKKQTRVHSKDGRITGKTESVQHKDGSKRVTNYKNLGTGLILGPRYKATSRTNVDKRGNTRTKTF